MLRVYCEARLFRGKGNHPCVGRIIEFYLAYFNLKFANGAA
jgi:hypothetical protein